MNRYSRWLVLLPALIVLLAYLPTLDYEFVWDDSLFLRESALYRDPALWTEALSQPFVLSPNYFRPLGVLTFMAELRLGGLDSTPFHLTNILLHAINTLLVALLARHLLPGDMDDTKRAWLQAGAGLIYGLHPALVEGVAFVSSRFDLLVTTFLLSALLADAGIKHRIGRPLAVGLAFLLAALSKEMAATFILVLPLWHLARRGRSLLPLSQSWRDIRKSGDLGVYAGALAGGGLYLLLRYAALGYLFFSRPSAVIPTGNALQHLLLVGRSVGRYVVLTIWPFTNLTPIHYSPLPVPTDDLGAWATLVIALALVAGLVALVRRAPRSGWLAVAGTLALSPVINILPLELDGGAFVAERFLLFPMALSLLALVPVVKPLAALNARWGRVPGWVYPALWLVASVATLQLALPHWRDDQALWTWGAGRAPMSTTPPTNLALVYVNQGNAERGLAEIDRALQLDPTKAKAWNNLGLALFYLGNFEEAQGAFEEAVSLEPGAALYWSNLAAALREQDRVEEALRILQEEALPRDPGLSVAYLNLGMVFLRLDRPDLAVPSLQEALRLLPADQSGEALGLLSEAEDPIRWLRLGDNLLASDNPEGALAAFEQAGRLGAEAVDVAVGLGAALTDLDALSEAEELVGQALEQTPRDARLYNILGVIARKRGDLETAAQHFNQAMTLAPDWETPRENLASLESESP